MYMYTSEDATCTLTKPLHAWGVCSMIHVDCCYSSTIRNTYNVAALEHLATTIHVPTCIHCMTPETNTCRQYIATT